MRPGTELRHGYDAPQLRALAKATRNAGQSRRLLALVESGPVPAVHDVVRWRLKDLVQWVWDEFRVEVSETTLGRELRALGYRRLSARPRHHVKSEAARSARLKAKPPAWCCRAARPRR